MSANTKMSAEEVLATVRPFIDQNQPDDYRLVVKETWFSKGLNAWIVSVDTDPDEVSGTDFARRLAEIGQLVEDSIEDQNIEIHVHPSMYRED